MRDSAGSIQFLLNSNTGNVGIGTTAPNAKLEVNGTIKTIAKQNRYIKTYAEIRSAHGGCDNTGTTFNACVSAADICTGMNYSGGTVVQDSGTSMAIVCMT